MDNEKELPKRKDIRLKNYDYSSPSAYFVTICTENRKNYFWNGSIDPQVFDWHSVGANCDGTEFCTVGTGVLDGPSVTGVLDGPFPAPFTHSIMWI